MSCSCSKTHPEEIEARSPATIIGIDCAAQDKNIGLAFGDYDGQRCTVSEVTHGKIVDPVASRIASWIPADRPTLLALDAPLGWPTPLAKCLNSHQAGDSIAASSSMLFSRLTDRIVKLKTGKKPLDVGADRIAHTACFALALIDQLRSMVPEPIPLQTQAAAMNSRI